MESKNIKLVITSSRILTSGSIDPSPGTIEINNSGNIVSILPYKASYESYSFLDKTRFHDVGEDVVMPGIVDAHVHLNEPGRTDWEGFETGTKAASAGGVTAIIDMPLNSIPPTTTVDNLKRKIESANGKCWIDVGFYGGIIPGNQDDLVPLIEAGVKGFKCFLIESGVEEFPCVNEQQVRKAYEKLQGTKTIFMFHAEMESEDQKESNKSCEDSNGPMCPSHIYKRFLDSRPKSLEFNAISLVIRVARDFPTVRTHIVHLSAANALDIIRKAKSDGIPLTVETCFHYLCLSAEEIPSGRTDFKCCPPVREDSNREELWKALLDGTIDYVVSDHSPCTADLKFLDKEVGDRDFLKAWGGISTLQFGLPVLWTEARKRGCSYHHLTTWLSKNTSKQVGLNDRKGEIKVGYDADIVIWSPEETFRISTDVIQFKNKVTPYMGKELYGVVKKTIVRGNVVYDVDNGGVANAPCGKLLI
ncbi:17295_t:CDS:2 [Acaulospora colombiana]|uniref:17295_t:CDS:1 n=1 Tax=Acaulospora colombiana TaxID=27376 RepID=A0ACA9KVA7_9GLOM|nr:17295_t:CDS:2 [Acaulospora colombiana]